MKLLKNSVVGFIVSFIGSIPLGYLNIVGFEIYTGFGFKSLLLFLLGVVIVEAFVVYFTMLFAHKLVENKKLMKAIDVFGIVFLLFLAYSFYSHANQSIAGKDYLKTYVAYSPFLIGLLLSSLNFLQLPFWTAWNLYLINASYIKVSDSSLKGFFVAGTVVGTVAGMLTLIYVLHTISTTATGLSSYLMPVVIPLIFIVLALVQLYKVVKKYVLQ